MTDLKPFELAVRVYWEDTDAGGVVYHSVYLNYLERARSEWLRGLGICQRTLGEVERIQFVVVDMKMHWRRPARYDDLLTVTARPTARRGATISFEQEVFRGEELLAGAEVRVAVLDARSFRPVRLPKAVAARMDAGGPVVLAH
jgi:acyl-CoA thioester hydrolase